MVRAACSRGFRGEGVPSHGTMEAVSGPGADRDSLQLVVRDWRMELALSLLVGICINLKEKSCLPLLCKEPGF